MDENAAREYLAELEDDYIMQIINEWIDNKGKENTTQAWRLIPKRLLVSEWKYYAKTSLVRDTNIYKIEDIVIENALKLYINTMLFGHTSINPFYACIAFLPEDMTESEFDELFEDFEWFACDTSGNWRISDYAVDKIIGLVIELIKESDTVKKLGWIDRILNVVHQRSDLSSWFVQDGWSTLAELAN